MLKQQELFGNVFKKQLYNVFQNKNPFGNLEYSRPIFYSFKYLLKITFIYNAYL